MKVLPYTCKRADPKSSHPGTPGAGTAHCKPPALPPLYTYPSTTSSFLSANLPQKQTTIPRQIFHWKCIQFPVQIAPISSGNSPPFPVQIQPISSANSSGKGTGRRHHAGGPLHPLVIRQGRQAVELRPLLPRLQLRQEQHPTGGKLSCGHEAAEPLTAEP